MTRRPEWNLLYWRLRERGALCLGGQQSVEPCVLETGSAVPCDETEVNFDCVGWPVMSESLFRKYREPPHVA